MKNLLKGIILGKEHGPAAAIIKPFLAAGSLIYGFLVKFIVWLYRAGILPSYKPTSPVISVGNITAGGSGKTPLVLALARYFRKKGIRPVILTRGYMTREGVPSDEVEMLREALEDVVVASGSDRVSSARETASMADLFILDDGFQHWRIRRDLDIVVIDATNPFGNGWLLPRGVLREPVEALKRADIFVLTRTDLAAERVFSIHEQLTSINPRALVVDTVHAPMAVRSLDDGKDLGLDFLRDDAAVICGIGAPDAFCAMLNACGTRIIKTFIFDDHHDYQEKELQAAASFCRENKVGKIFTTHKDAVKIKNFLKAFQGVGFYFVEIEIRVVHGQAEFFSRIDRIIHP